MSILLTVTTLSKSTLHQLLGLPCVCVHESQADSVIAADSIALSDSQPVIALLLCRVGHAWSCPAPQVQAMFAPPFNAPAYPALQVHCVAVIDCAGEFEFALMDEHSVHAWNPVELLYVPAAQGSQFVPVKPASHSICTQSLDNVLPLGDVNELGHARHTDGPIVDLYVPAAHRTQL